MSKINLGDEVTDKVTGIKGIAIAFTKWLNGCVRWTVQPRKLTKEGKVQDSETIDEGQLSVTKCAVIPQPVLNPGGPRPAAKQLPNAKRR